MSLLVTPQQLRARHFDVRGELRLLAEGLREELVPLLAAPPEVPREKALLSRAGGRCSIDGSLLRFDAFDPRHICPLCRREFVGGLHDRFRLYWYQLWLAERIVHASLLGVLTGDVGCRDTAITLLDRYADQYLKYPNADNVLGPSRPFFSTYLESIWLLQIAIAVDLLETGMPSVEVQSVGARVRDKILAPSAALIASYDEGMSNRQVWNNAALMASARLLDDRHCLERAVTGPSGLHAHLEHALLADGTWYEGENYHLFAHRGLWYGVQIAIVAEQDIPHTLARRYREGFAAPFRTLLPDLTYPSRRDSQYAISIRQPRFAESCELGLTDRVDPRLLSILARLYDTNVPRGDTGRHASSADVERNVAGTGLARADLSWRTLLCARPTLPTLSAEPFRSDLLPAQGLGILRRADGALYVSLDYGHSGGGHGHPDRLNLSLADGQQRWFDDPGTGSYVDPSLHWYRSTLAHHAPLIDGCSQPRVHGTLLAYEDRAPVGWMSARARLASDMWVRRTIVVCEDYLLDILDWEGDSPHTVTLPFHGVAAEDEVNAQAASLLMTPGLENGFSFLADTSCASIARRRAVRMRNAAVAKGRALDGWLLVDAGTVLCHASAPTPPGNAGTERIVLVQHAASAAEIIGAWTWREAITSVERDGRSLIVRRTDGSVDHHRRVAEGWDMERRNNGDATITSLRGQVQHLDVNAQTASESAPTPPAMPLPAIFHLGAPHYRRSEVTWEGAGGPHASVIVSRAGAGSVLVEIEVPLSQRLFVPAATANHLDNEPASINGDSVQLYASAGDRTAGLLLVPESSTVSGRPVDGWTNDLAVDAQWRPTASGYRIEATIHVGNDAPELALDVLVNDVIPGRARRRGQLVLSGARDEFVYLRGDRHEPSRLLRFTLANV